MLRSIQCLRALAALSVVLTHSLHWKLGAFGVDLFFVISGYVITLSAQGKTAGHFMFDRLWRIYPIYWIALLPWLAFAPQLQVDRLLTSITLWPIYSGAPISSMSYLLVAWTLSFEMLFYCSVALIKWRGSSAIPVGLFGGSLIASFFVPTALFGYLGNPIIFEFLLGAALTRVPLKPKLALAIIPLALILLSMSDAVMLGRQEIVANPLRGFARLFWWGVPAASLFYAAICHEKLFSRWAGPLVALGAASYSLYLFHMLAMTGVNWLFDTVAAVLLALFAWWFIERRILLAKPKWPPASAFKGKWRTQEDSNL